MHSPALQASRCPAPLSPIVCAYSKPVANPLWCIARGVCEMCMRMKVRTSQALKSPLACWSMRLVSSAVRAARKGCSLPRRLAPCLRARAALSVRTLWTLALLYPGEAGDASATSPDMRQHCSSVIVRRAAEARASRCTLLLSETCLSSGSASSALRMRVSRQSAL